jgi:hypothetical protein
MRIIRIMLCSYRMSTKLRAGEDSRLSFRLVLQCLDYSHSKAVGEVAAAARRYL